MSKHRVAKKSRQKRSGSALGIAAVAVAGAAALGVAPTLSTSPDLMASLHYLRGTNIGSVPTDAVFNDFIGEVITGAGVEAPDTPYVKVPYNAGFFPFSRGGFRDLTFDASVAQGVRLLEEQDPAPGDIIFGFSQGAVAASIYKGEHTGNTYVLVANPNRPNGGVLQRFKGLKVPLVNITFNGATPDNGDFTIDVTRQYDGWSDFPTYLWNPLAVANALVGIALVHGNTQWELSAEDLEEAREAGSDYYQFDADSNTAYYVIRTYPIPLLMPLQPILPASWLAALDAPLRAFIETAYDRSDYSKPTRASLFAPPRPRQADTTPQAASVETETDATAPDSAPAPEAAPAPESAPAPAAADELPAADADAAEVAELLETQTADTVVEGNEAEAEVAADEPEQRASDRDRTQRRAASDQKRRDRSSAA
ncbi:PE-PPE domain-containing protein [Mycobacterium sp. pV006]|uniref:PE-PPE domain-containing protein n=1 Tax=Mycobacterium sp. pV006 TaxID=3238983 RepID=UPI00351BA9C8